MAATTVPATATPDLDAVVFWLTFTMERIYEARGVFPQYRAAASAEARGVESLHFITWQDAEDILADARSQLQTVRKGARVAYVALESNLAIALAQARERRSLFNATGPKLISRENRREVWQGTKEQLQSIGCALSGPYPGEPGAKRWRRVLDGKMRKGRLSRASDYWPYFEVEIECPTGDGPRELEIAKKRAADDERRMRLAAMPKTRLEFREVQAAVFWAFVKATAAGMTPDAGYCFKKGVVGEFMEVAGKAYWVLMNGDTEGCSPMQALQRERTELARGDQAFQAFMSRIRDA